MSDSEEDTRSAAEKIAALQKAYAAETKRGDQLLQQHAPSALTPLSGFYFACISCKRPGNVCAVEGKLKGCDVTWIVGAGDKASYEAAGAAKVVEGGGLCASRNLALALAFKAGKVCVQVSDDIKSLSFVASPEDSNWVKPKSIQAANERAKRAEVCVASLGRCAQYIESQARATDSKLGGTYPCGNPGQACGGPVVAAEHFIVGDFTVALPSPERFDESMTLKEDYDFTCTHIQAHGRVARCNRLLILAEHYVNAGGAVAVRNASREKANIKHLRTKWPGVFLGSPRGDTEVRLIWAKRDVTLGGDRIYEPDPRNKGRAIYDQEEAAKARAKRLAREAAGPSPPKAKKAKATQPKASPRAKPSTPPAVEGKRKRAPTAHFAFGAGKQSYS